MARVTKHKTTSGKIRYSVVATRGKNAGFAIADGIKTKKEARGLAIKHGKKGK